MDQQEREIIEGLFQRIAKVARCSPLRDAEAEDLIRARVAEQPVAVYYMAQAIVMQEVGLHLARDRLRGIERRGGDFAEAGGWGGGLLEASRRLMQRAFGLGWAPRAYAGSNRRGGGFLSGAANNAIGIGGGIVLGDLLSDALGPDAAAAANVPEEPDLAGIQPEHHSDLSTDATDDMDLDI
jgi:hypothetical protein